MEISRDVQPDPEETPRLHVVPAPDATDWEGVYRDHVVPVYRYVYARCGNRPDAEDVTAQVFLRALPRLRLSASTGEIRAYLLTTARSVLAEHWTTRFGVDVDTLGDEAWVPGVDPPLPDAGVARATALLDLLPDRYRRVLELRFLSGMSVRETAKEMGISVANAKVLQWRALRRAASLGEDAAR